MPRLISEMSDSQIEAEINNHLRLWSTLKPENMLRYRELVDAAAKRTGFDIRTSRRLIEEAAAKRKFISYKDLADASGVSWGKAYRLVPAHLWEIVLSAKAEGLPMLSAIVVNKENLSDGTMKEKTLAGFIAAAEALGYDVSNSEEFLREQQSKVFEQYKKE